MEGDGSDKRVKNWTSAMTDVLLKECELRYQRIEGKFTFSNTHANKEKAWGEITDIVNRYVLIFLLLSLIFSCFILQIMLVLYVDPCMLFIYNYL